MEEEKRQHLEFIQNTITRMNTNSFQIKEWCVTLIAALFALNVALNNTFFLFICYLPIIIFWGLDAYYLQQERKFRGIYENVAGIKNDIEIKDYEMPINKFVKGKYGYWNTFFSKTLRRFYFAILILISIVIIGVNFNSFHNCQSAKDSNQETVSVSTNMEKSDE